MQLSHQLYLKHKMPHKIYAWIGNEISRQNSAFSVSAVLYFTWCGMVRCGAYIWSHPHTFVRSIIRTSKRSPCIILYTDDQMTDIKNLCCTGQTVLGIDKTFMLCKMHVTVTCYKQMTVNKTRTNKPPVFIGPLFIHDNSDFDTYTHFFHHLKIKLMDTNIKTCDWDRR